MKLKLILLPLVCALALSACGSVCDGPGAEPPSRSDRPTVPENAPEGIDYDFTFTERYDDNVDEAFSLILPKGNTFCLFEKFEPAEEWADAIYDGDGRAPHDFGRYWYSAEEGNLVVGTDLYELDEVEYISYLRTDIVGAGTNLGIAVGSSEAELLKAYTDNLYYIEPDYSEAHLMDLDNYNDPGYNCDHAYAWQPFTPETNECRDVTFYITDGKVSAIEIISPYELRYVYGYDRGEGLRIADNMRAELADE